MEAMRALVGDAFFYMLYFQEPGVADADLGADAARTLRRMLAGLGSADGLAAMFASGDAGFVDRLPEPDGLPGWLSADELAVYVDAFERTGFTGGINWYRNLDRNWHLTEAVGGRKVEAPSLFVAGAQDPVLLMSPPDGQEAWLADHRGSTLVDGSGHWVQQEAPDAVNAALVTFLAGLEAPWGRPAGDAPGAGVGSGAPGDET
jgi:pimeloyl-ACP methyl ester carboxylesterase